VAMWIFIFSLPFLLRPANQGGSPARGREHEGWGFLIQYSINCLTWVLLTYLNTAVLLPRFFSRKQYNKYGLSLLAIFLVLFAINWLSFRLLIPGRQFRVQGFIFFYIFPSMFFLACSTAVYFFREKLRSDHLAKERETENLKTELLFLRSQVNPHFLFNVLNNMVALARKGSDQLEPSLIKLSSLLRYMLYEASEEKVLLNKELEYLQSYIDLQTQRFRKSLVVDYQLGEIDDAYLLEPMLLIPFVENAFKHGVSGTPDAVIRIGLKAVKGVLQLSVCNKYYPEQTGEKDKSSGIGLTNVRRRLSLLYPERHELLIQNKDDWFNVSLTINLY
jgi:LytS/YehU family sensor histidine kinase